MNNYKNLATAGARDNMGGASVVLLYAPIAYFIEGGIKKVLPNPATLEDSVTISTTHQFKPGKGFHKMRCILDTNKLKADPVGERGGRGIKEEYEGKVSGNTRLMAALMAMFKNDEFIVLVPLHDGQYVQLGSDLLPAEILPSHDTGSIESGVNSMMIKITNFTMSRAFYTGAIQLANEANLEAKFAFSTVTASDSINIRLGGNIIATATADTFDAQIDVLYKLLLSLSDLGIVFGVQGNLIQDQLVIRTFPYQDYNWLGQTLVIEILAGAPVVSTTSQEMTFTAI